MGEKGEGGEFREMCDVCRVTVQQWAEVGILLVPFEWVREGD